MDMKWRKSTRSTSNGGDCVEVADNHPGTVYVRDSKDQSGPMLSFDAPAFRAFIEDIKAGRFDPS
jgi:hypothetical protein